ncbi:hypothetical protein LOB72_09295 [Lactobacillus delbrueckii subsp. lactis]|uniref:hypothetical protein n=1 Tax=Lactobacillus delbrueckii TaxID=1584 RepID=UPI001E538EA9|nr:hypothetical protein [Lactobacillus delbrueckii]MCD5448854.1 hypothetical protein [Lactobacillus delbrueckii subsp. lactis]
MDQVHWLLVKNEEFADTRVPHSSVFSCLKQKNKKFYLFSPGKNYDNPNYSSQRKRFSPVSENKGKTISSSACYNSAGCTHDKANEKVDLTFQK